MSHKAAKAQRIAARKYDREILAWDRMWDDLKAEWQAYADGFDDLWAWLNSEWNAYAKAFQHLWWEIKDSTHAYLEKRKDVPASASNAW